MICSYFEDLISGIENYDPLSVIIFQELKFTISFMGSSSKTISLAPPCLRFCWGKLRKLSLHYSLLFGRHKPLHIQYSSLGMNTVKYASLLLLPWRQKAWNNGPFKSLNQIFLTVRKVPKLFFTCSEASRSTSRLFPSPPSPSPVIKKS